MSKPTLEQVVTAYLQDELEELLEEALEICEEVEEEEELAPEFIISVNGTIIDEGIADESSLLKTIENVPVGTVVAVYELTTTVERD